MALLVSCSPSRRTADTNGIDLEVKIGRFDSALWTLDREHLPEALAELNANYGDITLVYLQRVVEFGLPNEPKTVETLQYFFADTAVASLYNAVQQRFTDMSDYESELTEAFRRAKYFFPKHQTPTLYTHLSGLNQSMVVGDGFVSASIDNYMGADFPLYERVGIYTYLRQVMRPERLVPDYVVAWLMSEFPFVPRTGELQEAMIYRGKILYTAATLLPNSPDSLLMGYTAEQWHWCQKHEHEMWLTLVGNKHLFSRDAMIHVKYLNDAPFTKPFTQESPGRAGAYVGWQIVEKFMAKNSDVSLVELMATDSEIVVRKSGYNP